MSNDHSPRNPFLTAPLGAIFTRTAVPIIFVMSMNGLLTVADAIMLGLFVGPGAVAAVTAVFPVFMLVVASATLVGSGMASVLARNLGASDLPAARHTFAVAHRLALIVGVLFILFLLAAGPANVATVAAGSADIADMTKTYLSIVIAFAPLQLLLSVNVDALRCEGRVGLMALISLAVSLANLLFNYVLIMHLDMGVAGSAYGTALAQLSAFAVLLAFRAFGRTPLRLRDAIKPETTGRGSVETARAILALGAPQSLGFMGLALVSGAVIAALQLTAGAAYGSLVSAYGIVTRILTFAYLPLLGMSQTAQVIIGNNRGAGLPHRADGALRIGLAAALAYCLGVQAVLAGLARPVASLFVEDAGVIEVVGRIMPVMTALYVLSGPLMLIGAYFQAIGDAKRAALLGLAKPYLFTLPLVILLAATRGETAIWYAMPLADGLLLVVTVLVLRQSARRNGLAWGLFTPART